MISLRSVEVEMWLAYQARCNFVTMWRTMAPMNTPDDRLLPKCIFNIQFLPEYQN